MCVFVRFTYSRISGFSGRAISVFLGFHFPDLWFPVIPDFWLPGFLISLNSWFLISDLCAPGFLYFLISDFWGFRIEAFIYFWVSIFLNYDFLIFCVGWFLIFWFLMFLTSWFLIYSIILFGVPVFPCFLFLSFQIPRESESENCLSMLEA